MSENLDLVRSIFAASERGEFRFSAEWHPEIEFVVADGPEPGRWFGRAGIEEGPRAILRLIAYWNRERALADLGLAPEAG